jgi:hypothetical protein
MNDARRFRWLSLEVRAKAVLSMAASGATI